MELQLNPREQLIERILRMSIDQVAALTEYAETLEDALQDAEDLAIIKARKGEVGIPLDEALNKLGYTREELEAEARAEGWMK